MSLPKPYFVSEDQRITIYHGDSLTVASLLDGGSIDLVLTDPPYNVRSADIVLAGRSAMARDFGEWDEDWSPVPHLIEWERLLRAGGSVLAFTSDRLLSAYREGPLKPRGTVVWHKDNPPPHPRPAYVQATEWIVWLQKEGAAATWNGNGYTINVEHDSAPSGSERTPHPTQKPIDLMRRLIQRHSNPGDMILDPFMGSGTTLRAAADLGRRAIGIELHNEIGHGEKGRPVDRRYCDMAVERLRQGVLL